MYIQSRTLYRTRYIYMRSLQWTLISLYGIQNECNKSCEDILTADSILDSTQHYRGNQLLDIQTLILTIYTYLFILKWREPIQFMYIGIYLFYSSFQVEAVNLVYVYNSLVGRSCSLNIQQNIDEKPSDLINEHHTETNTEIESLPLYNKPKVKFSIFSFDFF